ncbi:MAG TPA: AmmeMemoRadiSam system radical SAM enzyme [Nitrososphaerales archaeon]|nr:AmmeMemoRadiSam system radical SAM enzyme [Nitrososphaerales archaeon]
MKEASLYIPLSNGKVKCTACARYCQIGEDQIGLCGIRQNVGGKLQLLAYGKLFTGHIDPIEKKPVTHYHPGTRIFSVATSGCNWLCRYCQNYDISQRRKVEGMDIEPSEVSRLALAQSCQGIAYTYNEPTIFVEYARDIGIEAHKKGLFNIFVSNGFATPDTVGEMKTFLDCITVDFKGSGETNFVRKFIGVPSADPILQTLSEIRRKTNIHIEITDLIVPEVGESLEQASKLSHWIYDNLGPDTPVHFLRFHPDYKMMEFPVTPINTLEAHHRVAKQAGLRYAYLGNVPGHPLENTYCAECNEVAVRRYGYEITGWNLDKENRCNSCGAKVPIEGGLASSASEERFLPAYF